MEEEGEKRNHARFPLRLSVLCHRVGTPGGSVYMGSTVNVSPGGMLMEVSAQDLTSGDLVSVEMSIPPTEGLLEYGGRFTTYAKILRVEKIIPQFRRLKEYKSNTRSIALEFCESPKLVV
jgi:hypothetical protein